MSIIKRFIHLDIDQKLILICAAVLIGYHLIMALM